MGLLPGAALRPEQAVRGPRPVQGGLGLGRGQGAVGRHQQKFRLLVERGADFRYFPQRGLGFRQGIVDQPGGQQHGAPFDAHRYGRHLQPLVAGGRRIEVGQRGWEVPRRVGGQRPIEHRSERFQFLSDGGVQPYGRNVIGVGPAGRPQPQVGARAEVKRASRPEQIARAPQHDDRVPRVFQSGREPAQSEEQDSPPVQHLRRQDTRGPAQGGFEGGQPGRRPAREEERHAQAGQDIGFTLGRARAAGLAQCLAQFTDPGLDVAEVAQHDPRGLMGHGGVMRARPSGEHGARSGQRSPRPGRGQRDQIVHLARTCRGRAPSPDHRPILGLQISCGLCIFGAAHVLSVTIAAP
jgi:hypothetical protein